MSTWSSASTSSSLDGVDDEPAVESSDWGGLRWGGLSWLGGRGESKPSVGPSAGDFARNFDVASPDSERDDPYDDFLPDDGGDDSSEDYGVDDADTAAEDPPLPSGTYRALYAFEPEGTAEMGLEEDQLVHVIGRGGGIGWAIAEREDGGHALVPEGYLELVQLDEKLGTRTKGN